MAKNKTKQISRSIGQKELRELVQKNLRPSQIPIIKVISKHELLRVANAEYTECLICCNSLVQPVTLSCGHSCCLECLEEGSLMNERCFFCKESIFIKQIVINKSMQRFVRQSLALLGGDHRRKYVQRQRELKMMEKLRRINISSLQLGDDIDYRDSYRMRWFKGTVMEVQKYKENGLIYVEFAEEHKGCVDFEIYQSSSMDIAPAGYFSKRMKVIRSSQPRHQPSQRLNHSIRTQLSSNAHHLRPILSAH